MHAYRRFIEQEMNKRGWTAADLQRSSGLTKQNISRLLNDSRAQLQQRPDSVTTQALARAFSVDETVVLTHVAEAMGLPHERVTITDTAAISNEELLRLLAERLAVGGIHGPIATHEVNRPDLPPLARDAQPDGLTTGERGGAPVGDGRRGSWPRVPATAEMLEEEPRPWEKPGWGLAAEEGINDGVEARRRQDHEGEEGGS